MPTAAEADAASCCVIERNDERPSFQLRNQLKRSRCKGPFQFAISGNSRTDGINNTTINRASFNGGPGGVAAKPQVKVDRERQRRRDWLSYSSRPAQGPQAIAEGDPFRSTKKRVACRRRSGLQPPLLARSAAANVENLDSASRNHIIRGVAPIQAATSSLILASSVLKAAL